VAGFCAAQWPDFIPPLTQGVALRRGQIDDGFQVDHLVHQIDEFLHGEVCGELLCEF